MELPQETAENASQMRRVIVDQIEALAELNRIVSRHGRNLDVAEQRREPVLAVVGGRNEAGAPSGPSGRADGSARLDDAPTRPWPAPSGDARSGPARTSAARRQSGQPTKAG